MCQRLLIWERNLTFGKKVVKFFIQTFTYDFRNLKHILFYFKLQDRPDPFQHMSGALEVLVALADTKMDGVMFILSMSTCLPKQLNGGRDVRFSSGCLLWMMKMSLFRHYRPSAQAIVA